MEPPSPQLIERLQRLQLCRRRDLQRCRSLVRRLARDLPTFDTVWIDALVQAGKLTHFQARVLDSQTPDRLDAGPFVLVNQLGHDGRFERYLAREREGKKRFLLTRVRSRAENSQAALDRLRRFIHATSAVTHRSLNPPVGCAADDAGLLVVSRWGPGPTLDELVIRRGRFPTGCVLDVAAQLTAALAALEPAGCPHGDVRLRNVTLTPTGHVVLHHAGVLTAVEPELTIHADLPPGVYDTVAPELIGTGEPASTASDAYALGCVLWELLTGRPPFPHGDPLTKLAAHQTQTVPDVRRFAPDTPDAVAALLSRLTARDPDRRPHSFQDLARELKRRGTASRLRRFGGTFQHPVRVRRDVARRATVSRVMLPLLLTVVAAGLTLLHAGARAELRSAAVSLQSRLSHAATAAAADPSPDDQDADDVRSALRPFPTEINDGVLTLDGAGPYAAGRIAAVGPLVIRGGAGQRAVVVIRDEPLEVWAEQVVLENVEVRRESGMSKPGETDAQALVVANAQFLGVRDCSFETEDVRSAALDWTALDAAAGTEPRVALANSVFRGPGTTVRLHTPPAVVQTQNVLVLGGDVFLSLASAGSGSRSVMVALRQTTLRRVGSLLHFEPGRQSAPAVAFVLENSVFDVPPDRGALIRFAGDPPADWVRRIRITGQDSFVRPDTLLAAASAVDGGTWTPLDPERLSVDGMFAAHFEFAGPDVENPVHAAVSGTLTHGHTLTPPGADPQKLTPETAGAYNSEPASP